MSVFSVRDLQVRFGAVEAVRGASFDVEAGRTLAIVGESGSGKSASLLGAVGLLPASASVKGSVLYQGREILRAPSANLREIWGAQIGFVFQDPLSNLHPLKTVGDQIGEAISAHRSISRKEKREQVLALLNDVEISNPAQRFSDYPRHLSGGMRQRVMIAMAIALNPSLVIADEPTTALDVTVQASILELLKRLQERHGTALVFVSHDLAVVSDIADDVAVMRDGLVVERASADAIYSSPTHAYTRQLLSAARLDGPRHYTQSVSASSQETLLDVNRLGRSFVAHQTVLEDVSFSIAKGEILGLVGESGSGKSTIGRLIAGLDRPDAGTIALAGQQYAKPGRVGPLTDDLRRAIQVVFQDPYASLNPRRSIEAILSDPFVIAGERDRARLKQMVRQLLADVELPEDMLSRFPSQLSGGQRQRIAIARAIASRPSLVVADEAVSALDITTQVKIVELLRRLRDRLGTSFLFISHDLGVVGELCDRVIVLEKGRIVEAGPTRRIFERAEHEYTRRLLASMPGRKRQSESFISKAASYGH
ncbi:ABC transporter ATP-binding protein [Rhizobium sp. AC44/96]|uniref:dipeptide ABC transporter ATP-binding protein n=1 Tax=unclassified Rhizobium TaxID=2613769 RepID=UPI00080F9DC8|nr:MULTISPECIES: ABC transporter ATP-binding protein [unclassified Rhizobium]MDM9620444.1 ABC transporter ATP-binding protein [Rhizobium sp. S96]OCJ09070.1 ABC transporter ATP-binding protein [Rhizobium sp. AC44/96]